MSRANNHNHHCQGHCKVTGQHFQKLHHQSIFSGAIVGCSFIWASFEQSMKSPNDHWHGCQRSCMRLLDWSLRYNGLTYFKRVCLPKHFLTQNRWNQTLFSWALVMLTFSWLQFFCFQLSFCSSVSVFYTCTLYYIIWPLLKYPLQPEENYQMENHLQEYKH